MHIVFSSDDHYAPHCGVAICSLLSNTNAPEIINIYVLDDGISEENKERISSLSSIRPSIIKFIPASSEQFQSIPLHGSYFANGKIKKNLSHATFSRILIPGIFLDIDKVIYLDCDIVVAGDILELWNLPIKEYSVLAVEEAMHPARSKTYSDQIFHSLNKPYFNAGVMVMNLEKLKKLASLEICNEIIERNFDRLLFADQDVLNIALEGTWKAISPKFNAVFWTIEKKYHHKEMFVQEFYEQDLKECPVIIHFTDRPKPWDYGCVDPRKKYYEYYLKRTSFKPVKNTPPILKERYKYLRRRFHLFRTKAFIIYKEK